MRSFWSRVYKVLTRPKAESELYKRGTKGFFFFKNHDQVEAEPITAMRP